MRNGLPEGFLEQAVEASKVARPKRKAEKTDFLGGPGPERKAQKTGSQVERGPKKSEEVRTNSQESSLVNTAITAEKKRKVKAAGEKLDSAPRTSQLAMRHSGGGAIVHNRPAAATPSSSAAFKQPRTLPPFKTHIVDLYDEESDGNERRVDVSSTESDVARDEAHMRPLRSASFNTEPKPRAMSLTSTFANSISELRSSMEEVRSLVRERYPLPEEVHSSTKDLYSSTEELHSPELSSSTNLLKSLAEARFRRAQQRSTIEAPPLSRKPTAPEIIDLT